MIRNYLKIAWRNIKKRKSIAFIHITGLAIGFTCATLIFLFISFHLSFDNFHRNSNRIYRLVTEIHREDIRYKATVPPGLPNVFKNNYSFAEKVTKIVDWDEQLITVKSGDSQESYKAKTAFTEPDFFRIFNFPLLHKNFSDELDAPNTAVITPQAAQKLFGDTPPIGKTFVWNNEETVLVTGVLRNLPENTMFTSEVFISLNTLRNSWVSKETWTGTSSSLQSFALLHPGQHPADIEQVMKSFNAIYLPDADKDEYTYKLQPFNSIHLDTQYSGGISKELLWTLGIVGILLLLIACINFINIAAAQSAYRSKEIGLRKVLGGFRKQLLLQFLTETFLITLIALIVGLGLSIVLLPYFNNIFGLSLSVSGLLTLPFTIFFIILLLGIPVLAGSYPGIILARIAPVLALKQKLTQKDTGGVMTRQVLITGQFIVSIILIAIMLLISKQIRYATQSDLGFDPSAIVMAGLPDLPDEKMKASGLTSLKSEILRSPYIEEASVCFTSPGAPINGWGTDVSFNGNPGQEKFLIESKMGDKDYLKTFGIRLVAGRNFIQKDSTDEVLVNETFGKKIGINDPEELIGKSITISEDYIHGRIVGVVEDFHDKDFRQNISPVFIAWDPDRAYNELGIKINRTHAAEAIRHIRNVWSSHFPDYIFEYHFLDERIAEMYESEQQFLALTRIFSLLAIFICSMGIYGLISLFVSQKTKEIGIRKVLGGKVFNILKLFSRDFLKMITIAGLIAGPIAWYFINKWLQHYTYRTTVSWWIFILPIGCMLLLSLVIITCKGYKAAMSNPAKSLRTE
ncbi:ABC transporter permease [Sinomicrobium soli]|uniref:ABC transporter permease n=1 Tax=Sinomicrobium sp. N-1-3-6 TaxID=2219864 RepID=UPI000DCC000F|nr:ABC transporter permease [Sinomicrobium sp. N-1-3-6]RAV30636.1 hypothetical protein DN748_03850 [Sinomicrobium sp. N-1-3-6]